MVWRRGLGLGAGTLSSREASKEKTELLSARLRSEDTQTPHRQPCHKLQSDAGRGQGGGQAAEMSQKYGGKTRQGWRQRDREKKITRTLERAWSLAI